MAPSPTHTKSLLPLLFAQGQAKLFHCHQKLFFLRMVTTNKIVSMPLLIDGLKNMAINIAMLG